MASSSSTTTAHDATTEKKMITLKCSDGVIFDVEEKVIAQSLTIKGMIEDDCTQDGIPLPNVTGGVLAKVIEYLRKHVVDSPGGGGGGEDADASEELKKWDEEFVKLDWAPLFEIILAANYLNINNLLDFLCQAVADNIKNKSPEEIRQIFGIENDFTPEELEKLQTEHQWAFDP